MIELNELHSNEELEEALEKSQQKSILLFKHSTSCPISAGAFDQYKAFLESSDEDFNSYMVKVIEDRDISNRIEAETGIKHESPQIFLISNRKVVWHTSHARITVDSIKEVFKRLG